MQSPELFGFGNRLYIVFVTSDTSDFLSTQHGNIRITRIEADDPNPSDNHYRLLNAAGDAKRTEPEIQYLGDANHTPVIYYSQGSKAGETDCPFPTYPVGTIKLMRATTGYLWQN